MDPLPSPVRRRLVAAETEALLADLVAIIREAPFCHATMPRSGRPLSVSMTNCGPLGWYSDREGYRYRPTHPVTGQPWPPIPDRLLALWRSLTDHPGEPEACLINHYAGAAKMGLHQDRDEADFTAPVISVSLGDDALFRLGGTGRSDPTRSYLLRSGDVVMLAGDTRLAFHGIDRVFPGTSPCSRRSPTFFPAAGG